MASCYETGVPFIHLIKKTKSLFCQYYTLPNNYNIPVALIHYSHTLCSCLISLLIWLCASWNLHLPICFCCILQEITLMLNKAFELLKRINYDFIFLTWVTLLVLQVMVFLCFCLCISNLPWKSRNFLWVTDFLRNS